MNRAEKRKLYNNLKKANKKYGFGLNKAQMNEYIEFKNKKENHPSFKEGEKVRLNYDGLTSVPDYDKRRQSYKDFIEENKDKILTVKYDEKYQNEPFLVCLEEDTTNPKWLFTTFDLIRIDKEKEKNETEKGEM